MLKQLSVYDYDLTNCRCLSPLPGLGNDLKLGGGFAGYSGFLHYLQLASHELATIGINVTKNSKF